MPCYECENGMWRFGETGSCQYDSKESCETANKDYYAKTYNDYPQSATNNAKRALKWVEENGWGSCGTDVGKKRLNAIISTNDGFKLSELDLQIRGEGKVTGTDQSGLSDLKIADLRYDYDILNLSKKFFNEELTPELEEKIHHEATLLFPNFLKVEDTT